MGEQLAGKNDFVSVCSNCMSFLSRGVTQCPKCQQPIGGLNADGFQLLVGFSVYVCDTCNEAFSLQAKSCPHCGEIVSDIEYRDLRLAPLNKLKLDLFEETVQRIQSVLDNLPLPESKYQVTDEQYLTYLNTHNILSSEYFDDLRELFKAANMSSESKIDSDQTRNAITEILHRAQSLSTRYRELNKFDVETQLRDFHTLVLAHFYGLMEFTVAASKTLLVLTTEEFADMQRHLERILSRLAAGSGAMQDALQQIDIEVVHKEVIANRLTLLIGTHRDYEHRGLADLAAAIHAVINGRSIIEAVSDFAKLGLRYFHGLIAVDPAELPPDQSAALLMLAIESAAYFDPVSLRRQAEEILDLYSVAFEEDRTNFMGAIVASDGDIEAVTSNLLSLGDRLLVERPSDWPIDAYRHEITSSFGQLIESAYNHLINLPLAIKRVLKGDFHDYKSISKKDFGSKFNELKQIDDLRFATALLGISTVARNASMHGGVDTSGTKILLTQRDRNGNESVEEYTDEEFLVLTLKLVTTCRALLVAASLARIKFHAHLPPASVRMMRRVAVESSKAIVGLGGLSGASVNANSIDTVRVEASILPSNPDRGPFSDLFTAMLIARNFPNHKTVELTTFADGRKAGDTILQIAEANAHFQLPEALGKYSLLCLAYSTKQKPEPDEDLDQFLRKVIRPISLLLHTDWTSIQMSYVDPQFKMKNIRSQLNDLKAVSTWLSENLRIFNKDFQKSPVSSIQTALASLDRGLDQLIAQNKTSSQKQNSFENKHIQRCHKILKKWI